MAVQTIDQLKAKWITDYIPTQSDYVDLFDTIFQKEITTGDVKKVFFPFSDFTAFQNNVWQINTKINSFTCSSLVSVYFIGQFQPIPFDGAIDYTYDMTEGDAVAQTYGGQIKFEQSILQLTFDPASYSGDINQGGVIVEYIVA